MLIPGKQWKIPNYKMSGRISSGVTLLVPFAEGVEVAEERERMSEGEFKNIISRSTPCGIGHKHG